MLTRHGELFTGDAEAARRSRVAKGEILFHAGRIKGAFPRVIWRASRGDHRPALTGGRPPLRPLLRDACGLRATGASAEERPDAHEPQRVAARGIHVAA